MDTMLRTAESVAQANEWALVLASAGIPYRIEPIEAGWAVLVPEDEVTRGHRALRAYEKENHGARVIAAAEPSPGAGAWVLGLATALLLLGFFVLTGPPGIDSAWFARGAAAAGEMSGEPWRAVTALTLHADVIHVASNAIALGLLLPPLAARLGSGAAMALVLMSGALANLLGAAIQPAEHASVGASTAAFGAIGLLAGLRFRTRAASPGTSRRWWIVPGAALMLLAMVGTSENTDVLGHALGLVTGAALGAAAGISRRRPSARIQGALLVATVLAVAGSWCLALAAEPALHRRWPLRWPGGGVMVSGVAPLVIWIALAASFVIGLAAVLQSAGPATAPAGPSGVIRLPDEVSATIGILFGLAGVVFLAHLLRRALTVRREGEAPGGAPSRRIPPWLRTLTQVLSLLNFALFMYLLWRGGFSLGGLLGLSGGGSVGGLAFPTSIAPSAPRVIAWTFGALALATGVGALALAIWVALADRQVEGPDDALGGEMTPIPLEAAVEEGLEALRLESDPRRAIVRCYARFERAASESGFGRKPWLTPMEFMREALPKLPVAGAAVPTLTGLFELARFSDHALGPRERDRAIEALAAIKTAIDAKESDAVAP